MSAHMYSGGKGVAGICSHPQTLRSAFCCGISNISDQIKVAENTRDLFGLVGGSAGVRRLRPQGQNPARSGPSDITKVPVGVLQV